MSEVTSSNADLSLTGVHRLYQRAVEHFDAGELGQAEQCLEWLIEREPRHGHAYWYMARVKEQKGEPDQALFYWRACALLNDGRQDWMEGVYGKLVDHYTGRGDHSALYDFLVQAARADPSCRTVQKQLALVAEKLGRREEAVQRFTRCLGLGGSVEFQKDVQDRLMTLCLEIGDLTTLRDAGRSLLDSDPRSPRAHYLLSRYYEKRGQLAKALTHLKKSANAEGAERGAEVVLELAALYRKAGKPREALRALTRRSLLDGAHPFALWLAAECYEELGDAVEALTAWRRAAEAFGPASREGREAFFAYVETLIDLGREEEARAQIERAPDAIRRSDRARRYLAEAYERTGHLAESQALWEEMLAESPAGSRERVGPLLCLTRILLAEGQAEAALELLDKEELPRLRDAELHSLKAEVHEDLGQEEKALLEWDAAELLSRHDHRRVFEIRLTRADLLLKLSRASEAADLLMRMEPRHGREERYLALLGQVFAEVGNCERALEAWRRLAKCPRSRVRRQGLLQMARLYRDLGRLEEAGECYERVVADGHDMRAGLVGLAEISEERRDFGKAQSLWDALAEMYESSQALSTYARARAQNAREMTLPRGAAAARGIAPN